MCSPGIKLIINIICDQEIEDMTKKLYFRIIHFLLSYILTIFLLTYVKELLVVNILS